MTEELSADSLSLIWGSLRNLVDFETVAIQTELRLVGSRRGEFPVDAHHPVFLEMPKSRTRQDVSGRFGAARSKTWSALSCQDWSPYREIQLPVYDFDEDMSFPDLRRRFRSIVGKWSSAWIPDNIPCAAIAVSIAGRYCDERDAQVSGTLLLWANGTATLLHLDWFQGPVEDCISPEWYMKSSPLLPWSAALQALRAMYESPSRLENAVYSVCVQPAFMGRLLSSGHRELTEIEGWDYSWRYCDHSVFIRETEGLLDEIQALSPEA